MMDLPADVPLLWVGLVVVAVGLVGVAGALPTRPAPDAAGLAQTVDAVAANDDPARATHPLRGNAIRLTPRGVTLRRSSTTKKTGPSVHAEFAFGPVTPVSPSSPLWAVLQGEVPSVVFDSPVHFQQAVVEARSRESTWETGESVTVRGVNWDDYNVTLVGV